MNENKTESVKSSAPDVSVTKETTSNNIKHGDGGLKNILYIVIFVILLAIIVNMPSTSTLTDFIGNKNVSVIDKYYKGEGTDKIHHTPENTEGLDTYLNMFDRENNTTFIIKNSRYFDDFNVGDTVKMNRWVVIHPDGFEEVEYGFIE